jgi:hypothetical protein
MNKRQARQQHKIPLANRALYFAALLCLILLCSCAEFGFNPEETQTPTSAPAPTDTPAPIVVQIELTPEPYTAAEPLPTVFQETLYESDDVTLVFLGRDEDFAGERWEIKAENRREAPIKIYPQQVLVNGYLVNAFISDTIEAGATVESYLTFNSVDLAVAKIDKIYTVSMRVAVFDTDGLCYLPEAYETEFSFDAEPDESVSVAPDGKVLHNQDNIKLTAISVITDFNAWPYLLWLVENDSDASLRFVITDVLVNGSSKPMLAYDELLPPHSKSYKGADILLLSEIQKDNKVQLLQFSVLIYDVDSDSTEPLYELGTFKLKAEENGTLK